MVVNVVKKKIILIVVLVVLILVIPIYKNDDGVKEFKAILYDVKLKNDEKEIEVLSHKIVEFFGSNDSYEISSLDEVYDKEYVNYTDIRNLDSDYSLEDAINDNCFIIANEVYNDSLFSDFNDSYAKKEDCFIRVIQYTIDGDMLIYDVLYDSDSDRVYVVVDVTRDRFENEDIKLLSYEKMNTYEYLYHTYWVLYSGELNGDTLFTDNTFIISYV